MTDGIVIALVVIAIIVAAFLILIRMPKKQRLNISLSEEQKALLLSNVPFYKNLDDERKRSFESRAAHFLSDVKITGVKTEVTELDRILVAASAIIPIFAFPGWEYTNLNEVLLYPETFSEEFEQEGADRRILGMVGNGAMQNVMIISQHELRQGFLNTTGKTNTAIHEFVHLVDKTDGSTDGLPENIVPEQYITPWLKMMHRKITEIRKGKSDIDPYGATNEAEFFAVASEYFFERPDLLKQKHPELFELLEQIFSRPHKREQ